MKHVNSPDDVRSTSDFLHYIGLRVLATAVGVASALGFLAVYQGDNVIVLNF